METKKLLGRSLRALAAVVRRSVDVEAEFRTGQRHLIERRARIPDVLANADPERDVAGAVDRHAAPGREVALFVEDPVVRQVLLVIRPDVGAVVEHGGGIEDVVALVHEPHHRGDAAAPRRHIRERAQVGLDEGGLEDEVLGRIARQHQLGERHHVGAERARTIHPVDHQPGVGLDGAYRGIDLGQRDPRPSHAAILARPLPFEGQTEAGQDERNLLR